MSAPWTDAAVREALGMAGHEAVERSYTAIGTDTRTLAPGSLFVALRGERFDGHRFLDAAAEAGAAGAVVETVPDEAPASLALYRVPDTLEALGRLARYRRRELGARICAVTGTNGKTATKDMIRGVLGAHYRVHATAGNLNNLIGAPLTLLATPADAEAVVVEVATNAPGEIARLAAIVEPDAAVITGVAEGHLEGLGDLAGVLREKTALIAGLRPGGLAVVVDEPPELPARARELAEEVRVVGWSDRADAGFRAEEIELDEEGRVSFTWRGRRVALAFRGRPHARNALLALAVGEAWGVDADAAVRALTETSPPRLRTEVARYGALRVIADCYNSNPASLAAAVDLLEAIPRNGGRVAVVGTMRELGDAAPMLHRRAAELLAAADIDLIVATGDFVRAFDELAAELGPRLLRAEEPEEAYALLKPRLRGREVVLLKASRGVALERLLPFFERDWAGGEAAARMGD